MRRGATSVSIAGATGSRSDGDERLDQVFGNVGLLGYPILREIPTRLISPKCEICVITGPESVGIVRAPGDFVSLMPLTDHVDGIATTGLAYPIHGERLA